MSLRVYPTITLRCEECRKLFKRREDVWKRRRDPDAPVRCTKCARSANGAAWEGRDRPERQGEKHPMHKHGKTTGQRTAQKRRTRQAVIARDGDRCLICGVVRPGLHLHRVIYGSQGGQYVEGNCVLLCNGHHSEVHGNKREWSPKLLAHLAMVSSYEAWLRPEPGGE